MRLRIEATRAAKGAPLQPDRGPHPGSVCTATLHDGMHVENGVPPFRYKVLIAHLPHMAKSTVRTWGIGSDYTIRRRSSISSAAG